MIRTHNRVGERPGAAPAGNSNEQQRQPAPPLDAAREVMQTQHSNFFSIMQIGVRATEL
jgi:hypothetical protein